MRKTADAKAYTLAVATVLTVYGIETVEINGFLVSILLQQYLPFTVLKQLLNGKHNTYQSIVATVLTVYGIETLTYVASTCYCYVATVLTVYGIETSNCSESRFVRHV